MFKRKKKIFRFGIVAFLFSAWSISMIGFGLWRERIYQENRRPTFFKSAKGANDTIAYVNNARKLKLLPPLKENPILDEIAKIKACDMQNRGYFDHQDPEGRMTWHLFTERGYNYVWAGENIAEGQLSDLASMRDFLNSPEHRDNIMSPNYTEIGIATCGKEYVQEFGMPR